MMASTLWRVRMEDDAGDGRAVAFERLSQGIEDGVWGESDQVRGPQDARWTLVGEHPQLEEFVPQGRMFKSKESEEAEMDMTPMIDVTFQLLIFFMIAATYIVQKTLDMPKSEASNDDGAGVTTMAQLEQTNIIVKVAADGAITVEGASVALDDLEDSLSAAIKAKGESAEMVLDVEDDVQHQIVVSVLDAAGGAEIEKVHFVSRVGGGSGSGSGSGSGGGAGSGASGGGGSGGGEEEEEEESE